MRKGVRRKGVRACHVTAGLVVEGWVFLQTPTFCGAYQQSAMVYQGMPAMEFGASFELGRPSFRQRVLMFLAWLFRW